MTFQQGCKSQKMCTRPTQQCASQITPFPPFQLCLYHSESIGWPTYLFFAVGSEAVTVALCVGGENRNTLSLHSMAFEWQMYSLFPIPSHIHCISHQHFSGGSNLPRLTCCLLCSQELISMQPPCLPATGGAIILLHASTSQ